MDHLTAGHYNLCERTIHKLILDRVNGPTAPDLAPLRHFDDINELLVRLDATLCRKLLLDILPSISVLDPACGSGAFLVAAMKTLVNIYSAVIGKIKFLGDRALLQWVREAEGQHRSLAYYIKKRVITDNLYGVDLMEEGTEIAKLRLFLALVSSAQEADDLEPLPNIDFNIMAGNSLIGLLKVDPKKTSLLWGADQYQQLLDEKNRMIDSYRHVAAYTEDLTVLRDDIDRKKADARTRLNDILLQDFFDLGIKYEQATITGKSTKRTLRLADIVPLEPFHWGYEFDQIVQAHGGFDIIITNPPWEIFKPQAKEFFKHYSDLITKKKMDIKAFETQQEQLLKDPDIAAAWLDYQNRFPFVSAYYRTTAQYKNQISVVNGKKAGTDINLYKLFLEQCLNLLRPGGQLGIVIPSGVYTDLGAKQLREMLFAETDITGLFGFENRKMIFENVDSRFKFVVLTVEKGGSTVGFPAAFMRHDVQELQRFPESGSLTISVELVRRLSPDSLSIMEFKSDLDVQIAEKMLRFPLLGDKIDGAWSLRLTPEFHMTNDSKLFKAAPAPGRLPLYEGKMIHQFTHLFAEPRYWVDEQEGRKNLLGKAIADRGQKLDYQVPRLGFRDIARNTDTRTMIATLIPPSFHGNKLPTVRIFNDDGTCVIKGVEQLFLAAVWNSFTIDALLRLKVTATLNFFYIYQLPVPRLTTGHHSFDAIVERAAKLTCTTPEYDVLAQEAGLADHTQGVTDGTERARLRAELDGIVAHLYELTEEEFAHVLSTFPLVGEPVKQAAMEAYRTLAPKAGDPEIARLIAGGESNAVEFKSSTRWDMVEKRRNKVLDKIIVKTVAAFLNTDGGTLLIGVADNGTVLGLDHDYQTLGAREDRDGYEQMLTELLFGAYGFDKSPLIHITFHPMEGKEICRIRASRASGPVWVDVNGIDTLYVRANNTTRVLSTREAVEYVQSHWK